MKRQSLTYPYLWLVIAAGGLICAWSAARWAMAPPVAPDWLFAALVAVTIGLGQRLIIQIPQGDGELTVTDTLIFLTLLLYGGEAATLLATAEAVISKTRHNKKLVTFLFAGAGMACSTFVTTLVLRYFFGHETVLAGESYTARLVMATGLMALTQFFVNTYLVAVGAGLKNNQPIGQVWSRFYLWASISYFAGASSASLIAHLTKAYGIAAVLLATPILVIVYFTYRMYLKNVEVSVAQAEQARRHAYALQASEKRFHGAFYHAPIGIALTERDGHCLQVNHAWRKLCRYPQAIEGACNLRDFLHPEDAERCFDYLNRVTPETAPPAAVEARIVREEGETVWVLLGASALRDGRDGQDYLVAQIQDITERKRAEATLRQSEQLKSALLDAVTHDLRTPLTSIKASVTTLLAEFEGFDTRLVLPDEARRDLLDVIDQEADRLNSVIAGHVGLARLETGALGLHRFRANIHDIAGMAQARVAALTRGHIVEWKIAAGLPPVQADAHAVAEVLYSLIDNAAKYAPLHTRISVLAWQDASGLAHLAVEDEGAGIPADLRERVFEKFFRAPAQSQDLNGTGMGLAIARGIVEAHGGRVWIESGPRKRGARVVFTLPDKEIPTAFLPASTVAAKGLAL